MFPMWLWITQPEKRFLCASYSGRLAVQDSNNARRLVTSDWYQKNWGHKVQLAADQGEKMRWENTATGYRIATSVGGSVTGSGGSVLVLDDPIGVMDAQSDSVRESTTQWFDMTWSTRLNSPKTDAMITIMQRTHEDDISGHILKDIGGWEHLCIPAEYDCVHRTTSLGAYDPRKKMGELLWPARVGQQELDKLKKTLGVYGTSGQLQQDPSPPGGGILRVECFKLLKEAPQCHYIVQSCDGAWTEKKQNDPSAFTVWGVFRMRDGRNGIVLLDSWAEHLTFPNLARRLIGDPQAGVKGEWQKEYGGDLERGIAPQRADIFLIEDKSSGIGIRQYLQERGLPVTTYNPGNADKISRAHQCAPIIETGVVHLIASQLEGQEHLPMTWARDFLEECRKFPVASHDDYVDTTTQAIIFLRAQGFFDLPAVPKEEAPDRDYHAERQRRQNPYAM